MSSSSSHLLDQLGEAQSNHTFDRVLTQGFGLIAGATIMTFGLVELLFGHPMVAAIDILAGAILTGIGIWLLLGGPVALCKRAFLGTLVFLGGAITVLTGGTSNGVLLALPAFVFMIALIEARFWAGLWFLAAVSVLVTSLVLRTGAGAYPITFDAAWVAQSVYRTPLIVAIFVFGLATYYHRAIIRYRLAAEQAQQGCLAEISSAQREEARFSDFLSLASDGYWEADREHRFAAVFDASRNMAAGATTHPMTGEPAHPELKRLMETHRQLRGVIVEQPWDGQLRALRFNGTPQYDEDHEFLGYRGSFADVSEEQAMTRQLTESAERDALTGLFNRHRIFATLGRRLGELHGSDRSFTLAYLDLDRFKAVNDALGHEAGDDVLKRVGAILADAPGEAARLGGDEFLVLLGTIELDTARDWAATVIAAVAALEIPGGRTVGVSIGLVHEDPVSSRDERRWVRRADNAMYAAKAQTDRRYALDSLVARP